MEPGQLDLQQLIQQAAQLQEQLTTAQADLAEAEVTGTAGGGLVTVTMTGAGEVTAVKIDPGAVDPEDVETLEDLVVAALHAATEELQKLTQQMMGPLAAGLPGMPGMPGMPGTPGLPGFPG